MQTDTLLSRFTFCILMVACVQCQHSLRVSIDQSRRHGYYHVELKWMDGEKVVLAVQAEASMNTVSRYWFHQLTVQYFIESKSKPGRMELLFENVIPNASGCPDQAEFPILCKECNLIEKNLFLKNFTDNDENPFQILVSDPESIQYLKQAAEDEQQPTLPMQMI